MFENTVRKLQRTDRAQSLVETVVGMIFIVPIVLFLVDIAVVVLCGQANDQIAKAAARAAGAAMYYSAPNVPGKLGNAQYFNSAYAAAQNTVNNANKNKNHWLQNVSLLYFEYNNISNTVNGGKVTKSGTPPAGYAPAGQGTCEVYVQMTVVPPVPFPGFNTKRLFIARDVEAVTACPP